MYSQKTRMCGGALLMSMVIIGLTGCPGASKGGSEVSDGGAQPQGREEGGGPDGGARATGDAPKRGGEDSVEGMEVGKVEARKVKGDALVSSRRYRKLLEEGRVKVRGGDFDGGIATFREALKDDPNNAKLLGELSFAALRKEDMKLAERAARDCVRNTREGNLLGGCYYNLGRALEGQGDKSGAASAYELSLKARPGNEIVSKRLAGLSDVEPSEQAQAVPCGGMACTPCADLKVLCEALKRDALSEAGLGGEGEEVRCETHASRNVKEGPLEGIALMEVEVGQMGFESYYYLAMKTEAGWRPAATVGYVYNPGAFGVFEEGQFKVALRQLIEGGAPEVVVRTINSRHDSDMGIAEEEDSWVVMEQVCELKGGEPFCYGPLPIEYRYIRDNMEEVLQGDPDLKADPKLPLKTQYSFDVSYEDNTGRVKIAPGRGEIPDDLKSVLGTFHIREVPDVSFDIFMR